MTEEELESIAIKPCMSILPTNNPILESPAKQDIDRIGNNKQKESALYKAGVDRYKAFLFVKESLEATIRTEYRDSQGNVKYKDSPDVRRREWAVEQIGKYFGDFVTKTESNENGIRPLIIIRPGAEAGEQRPKTGTERLSRSIHIQPQAVSRDVQFMGNWQNNVVDISVNAIQRIDTE